jgi:hypothetical protein
MKKLLVISMAVTLLAGYAAAQSQLENPGFEEWDIIAEGGGDTIREPAEWSSLKTSDNAQMSTLAPVVCKRSSDAHSGRYSLELTNIMSLIVANGVATNGRIHPNIITSEAYMYTDTVNSAWNTPFTSKPDSVTGWFKYDPQSDDTLQVKIILHRGYGKQPDADYTDNWIAVAEYKSPLASGDNWVRFSTPFLYFNDDAPQYILAILNSGNGYFPVAGSKVLFDDLEMIYNSGPTSVEKQVAPSGYIYVDHRQLVLHGLKQTSYQSVSIRDLTGRLVWTGQIAADRIDISSAGLKKGIYLITLAGNKAIYSQKILLP